MDLKTILAKKKPKTERATQTRKPVEIADLDRPYSISEVPISPPLALSSVQTTESNVEEKTLSDTPGSMPITGAKPSFVTDSPVVSSSSSLYEAKNKLATNRQQTDNKLTTKWEQTDNKLATALKKPVSKSTDKNKNWQQTGNTTGNKVTTEVATNRQQTDNKVTTKIAFSELVGLQRDIIIFICHECKNSRSRVTEALTLEHIAMTLKRSTGSIKTTIQRLEAKGCLKRVGFKNGRGGWSCYEMPDDIYHEVLRSETGNKVTTNWQQSGNKVASQPTTEPATSVPSSSSSLILEKTTTTELSEEWNFDISPYARFGFTPGHLKQLASRSTISTAEVKQSLIEFSFDLDNDALPKIKTDKINFLMGILNKGSAYVSEGFKNEQEAMISEMARRGEAKRKKLLEEKFGAWEADLSDEERRAIEKKLPTHLTVSYRISGSLNKEVRSWLLNYFIEKDVK